MVDLSILIALPHSFHVTTHPYHPPHAPPLTLLLIDSPFAPINSPPTPGITGRLSALYVSRHYGRASYMIFTLCGVLVISFALYIYDLSAEPLDFTFTEFCAATAR